MPDVAVDFNVILSKVQARLIDAYTTIAYLEAQLDALQKKLDAPKVVGSEDEPVNL